MLQVVKKRFFFVFCFFVLVSRFVFSIQAIAENDHLLKEGDSLFLRRVIEFWQEGDSTLAKIEIENYLKNKKNKFFDYLYALLGDIYLQEEDFTKAAIVYRKIENENIKKKIFVNYIQSLYKQNQYLTVCKECDKYEDFIRSSNEDVFLRLCFLIGDSYYNLSLQEEDEKQIFLAKKAKKYFSKFLNTPLENNSLEHLADISILLKEYKAASILYLKLAEQNSKEKEIFLFKAATTQLNFDKDAALQSFNKICLIGKNRVQEAAINKLILLTEKNRYRDILLAKDQLEKHLTGKNKTILKFFLGKSYFLVAEYKRASKELKEFISLSKKSEKALLALDMLVICSENLQEIDSFDFSIVNYEKLYPLSKNLAKVYLLRSILHRKQKNYEKAKEDIVYIEKNFLDIKNSKIKLEIAKFYYDSDDYLVSRLKFLEFIKEHSDHKDIKNVWKYFINSSIKMLENLDKDKSLLAKNVLITDLEKFVPLAQGEEKLEISFLLAETKYEVGRFEDALLDLNKLFKIRDGLKQNAKANLLFALCYQKNGNINRFCHFAKKAIELKDDSIDEKNIRLNLFNTYLELAGDAADSHYLDTAAENLYISKSLKANISQENLLWLANRYYQKLKSYVSNWKNSLQENLAMDNICDRSIEILENLEVDGNLLKEKLIKLADLYSYKSDYQKQIKLLESIQEPKAYQDKIYFDIANIYIKNQENQKAIAYFKKLSLLNRRNFYNFAGKLYLTRLELNEIEVKDLNLKNSKLLEILNILKNIKMQKTLKNEPIHLEAALDYIYIQAKMGANDEKLLKLFENTKEEFSVSEDIISKDYQNSKHSFPEKKKIVDAYLKFIDINILYLQSKQENKEFSFEKVRKEELLVSSYLEKKLNELFTNLEKVKNETSEK